MNDPPPLDGKKNTQPQSDERYSGVGSDSSKLLDGSSKSTSSSSNPRVRTRLIPIVTTPKRGGMSGASSSDEEYGDDDDDDLDESEGGRSKIPSFHNSQGTPLRETAAPSNGSSSTPISSSTNPSSTTTGTSAANSNSSVSADQERQILLLMLLAQVCALHDPTPRTFTVHVLELFERGILGRQSIHFLFELGLVPSNTPRLLPPSVTRTATTTTTAALDDSKEEILDLATVPHPAATAPTSPQTLRSQEACAIRTHLEHLDSAQQQRDQQQNNNNNARTHLFHPYNKASTLVESPKQAAPSANNPSSSSWAVENHPLSLSRYQREFHQVRLLNAGSFGEVFQSTHKIDLKDYAVKRVAFSAWGYSKDSVTQVIREVHCLAQCDHPNVVRYYTSWLEPSWMTGSGATTKSTMLTTASGSAAEVRRQQKLLTDIQHMMVTGGAAATNVLDASASLNTVDDFFQDDAATLRNRKFSIGSSIDSHSLHSGGSSYDETSSSESDDDDRNYYRSTWSLEDETTKYTNQREDDSVLFASSPHPPNREFWESSSSAMPRPKKKAGDPNRVKYRYQICLFITMQLCHPATLGDWIRHRNNQCPDPNEGRPERVGTAIRIFQQISSGLAHVHKKGVVHRDLKPHNLFRSLEDEGVFLVGDFGLSKLIQRESNKKKNKHNLHSPVYASPSADALVPHQAPIELTEGVGTASYAAPEQVTTRTYGMKADIFSLGLILLELMCCFTTEHERMQTFYDCRHRRDIPTWISEDYPLAGKIILDCTNPSPDKRPSAEELLTLDLLQSQKPEEPRTGEGSNHVNGLKLELEHKNEQILAYQHQLEEKDQTIARLQQELAQLKLQHSSHAAGEPTGGDDAECVGLIPAPDVDMQSSSSSSEDGV